MAEAKISRNREIYEDRESMTLTAIAKKHNITMSRVRTILIREKEREELFERAFRCKAGEYPDDLSFYYICLSTRLLNCLNNAGIKNVGQARDMRHCDLLRINWFGHKTLRELYSEIWGTDDLEKVEGMVEARLWRKNYEQQVRQIQGQLRALYEQPMR